MKHALLMLALAGASLLALNLSHAAMALFLATLLLYLKPRLGFKWALGAMMLALPMAAFAATTAPPVTLTPTPSWLSALIPVAVPIAIAGLKLLLPKLPAWTLPTIVAPLLGVVADLALHFAGVSTLGPAWGALLGSAGVGLREIQDQVKQQVAPPPANSANQP